MIRTKSVYSTINRQKDGLRVLVTRFLGPGLVSGAESVGAHTL